jgi:hypothetical protein
MQETPTHVYVFGGHRWHHSHMIEQIMRAGLDVGLIVEDDSAVEEAIAELPYRPWLYRLPAHWSDEDLEELARVIQGRGLSGPWSASALDDFSAPAAAALNAFGGIPTYPVEAALATLHKHRVRGAWNRMARQAESSVCAPVRFGHLRFPSFESRQFRRTAGEPPGILQTPLIVKPDCLDDSLGVSMVHDAGQVPDTIRSTLAKICGYRAAAAAVGFEIPPEVLVEEAIAPDRRLGSHGEFSAQMLSRAGVHRLLGVTDKIRSTGSFSEQGHVFPSIGFPPELHGHLERSLATLLDTLEVVRSISTWDLIVTDGGRIALVEGQLRPSGNHIMQLHELATGVNPFARLFGSDPIGPGAGDIGKVAAVILPSPVNALERVDRVEFPEASRCRISVDNRLYTRRCWTGPEGGDGSLLRILYHGDSAMEAAQVLSDCLQHTSLVGRNAHGDVCSTALAMPEWRLGGCTIATANR